LIFELLVRQCDNLWQRNPAPPV